MTFKSFSQDQLNNVSEPSLTSERSCGTPGLYGSFSPKARSSVSDRRSTLTMSVSPRFRKESTCLAFDVDSHGQVRLNVGGTRFTTTRDILHRYPATLLGSLSPASPHYNRARREYFFDRNATIFASILDLYRTNELHLPRNFCGNAALKELEFWEVPAIWVSACCWNTLHMAIRDRRLYNELKYRMENTECNRLHLPWKRFIWRFLKGRVWHGLMLCAILLTIVMFFADSNPRWRKPRKLPPNYEMYVKHINHTMVRDFVSTETFYCIWIVDVVVLVVLVVEVVMKTVSCPHIAHYLVPGNIIYFFTLLFCVVGHIVVDYYERSYWQNVNEALTAFFFLQIVHFLRMLRIFEVVAGRHSALRVMWIAIQRSVKELVLLVIVFLILAVMFGSLAFYFEISSTSEPCARSTFATTLDTSWYWAIITMTTVGYGDMTPCTPAGRMMGTVCAVSGLIVLAMPVAVLTESFNTYNAQKEIRSAKRRSQQLYFRHPSFQPSVDN